MESDKERACKMEKDLIAMLYTCLKNKRKRQKSYREVMWSRYHSLRTSEGYIKMWSEVSDNATFFQYVGHYIFKELIKREHRGSNHTDSSVF